MSYSYNIHTNTDYVNLQTVHQVFQAKMPSRGPALILNSYSTCKTTTKNQCYQRTNMWNEKRNSSLRLAKMAITLCQKHKTPVRFNIHWKNVSMLQLFNWLLWALSVHCIRGRRLDLYTPLHLLDRKIQHFTEWAIQMCCLSWEVQQHSRTLVISNPSPASHSSAHLSKSSDAITSCKTTLAKVNASCWMHSFCRPSQQQECYIIIYLF